MRHGLVAERPIPQPDSDLGAVGISAGLTTHRSTSACYFIALDVHVAAASAAAARMVSTSVSMTNMLSHFWSSARGRRNGPWQTELPSSYRGQSGSRRPFPAIWPLQGLNQDAGDYDRELPGL